MVTFSGYGSTDRLAPLTVDIANFVMNLCMQSHGWLSEDPMEEIDEFMNELRSELYLLGAQLKIEGRYEEANRSQSIKDTVDRLQANLHRSRNPLVEADRELTEIQSQLMLMFNRINMGSPPPQATPTSPRASAA